LGFLHAFPIGGAGLLRLLRRALLRNARWQLHVEPALNHRAGRSLGGLSVGAVVDFLGQAGGEEILTAVPSG